MYKSRKKKAGTKRGNCCWCTTFFSFLKGSWKSLCPPAFPLLLVYFRFKCKHRPAYCFHSACISVHDASVLREQMVCVWWLIKTCNDMHILSVNVISNKNVDKPLCRYFKGEFEDPLHSSKNFFLVFLTWFFWYFLMMGASIRKIKHKIAFLSIFLMESLRIRSKSSLLLSDASTYGRLDPSAMSFSSSELHW